MTAVLSGAAEVAGRRPIATTPLVTVWIDDVELPRAALVSLGPVRVRQELSAPAACELEMDHTRDLTVRAGALVRVRTEGADVDVFDGEVVGVSYRLEPDGSRRVRLRCFDRTHRLRRSAHVTAHVEVTVGELAREFAATHGLGSRIEDDGPRWPRVLQHGESDLELLARLAADAGLCWVLEGDDLVLRRFAPTTTRTAQWGVDLFEAVVDTDTAVPTSRVRALGWDPVRRAAVVADEAEGAGGAGAGGSSAGGSSADRPGAEAGTRSGEALLAGGIWPGDDHASRLAQAELDRRAAAAASVRAVLAGDPGWRAGVALELADQPDPVAGPFLLTAVEHVVDAVSGYVCVATSQPLPAPDRRRHPGAALFTQAEVTAVDDPDRAGRVTVRFAALADCESEWLPVVALGAGAGKGLLCQPDVGDTVLVLHAADDPGRGVVVGGLYAADLPSDAAGVSGGAVRRFALASADGQRLLLDRDGDTVELGNGAGSRLTLAATGVRLHAETDLTIEAPGRRLLIRADAIDFERA